MVAWVIGRFDSSFSRDRSDGTGKLARVDTTLNHLADSLQPLRRQAHLFGLRGGRRRGRNRQGERDQQD
jgi:hypothetical protein